MEYTSEDARAYTSLKLKSPDPVLQDRGSHVSAG